MPARYWLNACYNGNEATKDKLENKKRMSIPLLITQVSDLFSVSNSYIAYTWKSGTSMGFETQPKRKVSNKN